jgi:hypothetical protein
LSEREKSSVSEMIGESLREIGILVLVFVPLEGHKSNPSNPWELVYWVSGTLLCATILIALGIAIERRRPTS